MTSLGVLALIPTADATEVLFALVEVLSYLLAAFPPATAQGPKLSLTHEQRGGNVPRHHGIKVVTRRFAFDLSVVRCFPRILRKSWAPRNDVTPFHRSTSYQRAPSNLNAERINNKTEIANLKAAEASNVSFVDKLWQAQFSTSCTFAIVHFL